MVLIAENGTGVFPHCGQGHSPPHPVDLVGEGAAYTRRVGGGAIPVACLWGR
jgi:hypothetical protein